MRESLSLKEKKAKQDQLVKAGSLWEERFIMRSVVAEVKQGAYEARTMVPSKGGSLGHRGAEGGM